MSSSGKIAYLCNYMRKYAGGKEDRKRSRIPVAGGVAGGAAGMILGPYLDYCRGAEREAASKELAFRKSNYKQTKKEKYAPIEKATKNKELAKASRRSIIESYIADRRRAGGRLNPYDRKYYLGMLKKIKDDYRRDTALEKQLRANFAEWNRTELQHMNSLRKDISRLSRSRTLPVIGAGILAGAGAGWLSR